MNKKKIALIIILSSIILTLGYFCFKIYIKVNKNNLIKEQISQIPKFNFTTLDGKNYRNADLPINQNILFVSFNPDCEYCVIEGKEFSTKAKYFSDTQIYFISSAEKIEIQKFQKEQNLVELKNIHFLMDKRGEIYKNFNMKSIPYMVLYSKNHKLINEYKGAINIDLILKQLKIEN